MPGKMPIVLFALAIALMLCQEIFLKNRERGGVDASRDDGSLKLIAHCRNAAFLVGIFSAFFPLLPLPGARSSQWLIGAGLIFAGLLMRFWSIAALGKFYTNLVAFQQDHKVVKSGPYKFIRHPGYAGAYLVYAGFGVAMGSVIGLVLVMVLIVYAFQRRIAVEEKVMVEGLGDEYRSYIQSTKKIIPFIY